MTPPTPVWASLRTLRGLFGIGRDKLRRHLQVWAAAGLVRVNRKGGPRSLTLLYYVEDVNRQMLAMAANGERL